MEAAKQSIRIEEIVAWLGTGSINVFGLPFAGKDTVCKKLASLFDGVVIGGGDILRAKEAPDHVKEHIATGALAPTDEYMRIVLPYFSQASFRGKPLILSSVGRWHGEEAGVLEATAESGHRLLAVVYLNIDETEVRNRWEAAQKLGDRGHRHDDAEHVLETRLQEFATKTLPVINFYRDQGMLIEINGQQSRQAVLNDILAAIYARAKS